MSLQNKLTDKLGDKKYDGVDFDSPIHAHPIAEVLPEDYHDEDSIFNQIIHKTREHLSAGKRLKNGDRLKTHIGVAGLLNLDIAAEANSDAVILLDINHNQAEFWNDLCNLIRRCEAASDFKVEWEKKRTHASKGSVVAANHTMEGELYQCENGNTLNYRTLEGAHEDEAAYLENALWLQDEEKYKHIRQLAKDGKIAGITLDILDTDRLTSLVNELESNGYSLNTNYLSNLCIYYNASLEDSEVEDFYRGSKQDSKQAKDGYLKAKHILTKDEALTIEVDDEEAEVQFSIGSPKARRLY